MRLGWVRAFAGRLALTLGMIACPWGRAVSLRAQDLGATAGDVTLAALRVTSWKEGDLRLFLLEGQCFVEQGLSRVRCDQCLAWVRDQAEGTSGTVVHVLAKGNARVERGGRNVEEIDRFRGEFSTSGKVKVEAKERRNTSFASHPLYVEAFSPDTRPAPATVATANVPEEVKALRPVTGAASNLAEPGRLDPAIEQAQYTQGGAAGDPNGIGGSPPPRSTNEGPAVLAPRTGIGAPVPRGIFGPGIVPSGGGGARRVRVFPRSSVPFHSEATRGPDGEQVLVFTGGINLIVEELETGAIVDIAADRVVLWTRGELAGDVRGGGVRSDGKQPFEAYLEGNVFIRQGNPRSVLRSDSVVLSGKQVYFNVNTNQALVLDGSVETFDDQLGLPLFMRSTKIRQLTPAKFYAERAEVTTSPYRGTPGYAFTARDAFFEEVKERIKNPFTRGDVIDPDTNEPMIRTRHFATTYSNVLRIEDFPVFYWPYLRFDVEDPLGPLEQVQIGNTNNLGVATTVSLDIWDLIGLDYLPIAENSRWLADIGYYSKRGVAGGSRLNYLGSDLFGLEGQHYGNALTWWIDDGGVDNLGIGRDNLKPPRDFRGRARFQHHQTLPNDLTLQVEGSYLSDNNVLESFFEYEYDTGKDQDTLLYVKQQRENWAWTFLTQPRINPFLPQNAWLPRLDGYLLGQPLWDDRLTYINHTSIAYGEVLPPNQYQLPEDVTVRTGRFDTRNEIDWPLQLGPWDVTPFVVGEFSGYTETTNTGPLGRIYGAGGVRTSLPFWRAYSGVSSQLFNLHGMAHKVAFNVDYLYGWANRSYAQLPTMDQVDDDTTDLVRRQNLLRSQAELLAQYGVFVPQRYDPRFIALRQNVFWLPEILDDMQNVRFGLNQRLQTKRGPVHDQRIIDWMVFDIGTTIFPQYDRDNFGTLAGLVTYKYLWNIGDRTAYISNMLYEPLDGSISLLNGIYLQRPPRTNLGFFYNYSVSGPFDSSYIGANGSYRFSKKYAGMAAIGTNLSQFDQVSYQLGFTRVGLDFVTTLSVVMNAGRDDFGFQFEILPRAQARARSGRQFLTTLPFGVDPTESATPILNNNRTGIITNPGVGGF